MPFCTACGVKNPDDARFCHACGHAMVTAGAEGQAAAQPEESAIPLTASQLPAQAIQPTIPQPINTQSSTQSAPGTVSLKPPVPLKAFDNPDELWKMYFYVTFFNIGVYFLTGSAVDFMKESGGFFSIPMGIFGAFVVAYLALAYWLIKKQAVDKNRSLWLLPFIAWHVYSYLDGLSSIDLMYAETSFDYYDIYISGVPETIILIRLFLALRDRYGAK